MGGSARVLSLRDLLLTTFKNNTIKDFTYTINMDECVVMGSTLLSHLLATKKIVMNSKTENFFLVKGSACKYHCGEAESNGEERTIIEVKAEMESGWIEQIEGEEVKLTDSRRLWLSMKQWSNEVMK